MDVLSRNSRIDVMFIAGLLLIGAIPLVVLRAFPSFEGAMEAVIVYSSVLAVAAVLWCWQRMAVMRSPYGSDAAPPRLVEVPWSRSRLALVFAALAGLAIVNFHIPVRQHFWGGGDEHIIFVPWAASFWSSGMDRFAGRPMALFSVGVAESMVPDSMEGFLILALILCLANGCLVGGILSQLYPGDWLVPVAGAALFIVNPCDSSRFYVIWTTNCYWMALFFCLLGIWLFLLSAQQGSRILLTAACVSMLSAGLSNEASLPVACVAPALICLSGRAGVRVLSWSFAWYGTMALLSARFIVHLCVDNMGYQGKLLSSTNITMVSLLENLSIQLVPLRSYWKTSGGMKFDFWLPCAGAVLALLAGCGFASAGRRAQPGLKRSLVGLAMAGAATGAGILPYICMPHNFRTQFLAGPGEASLLACLIGCVTSIRCGRIWTGVGVACTGWLIGVATINAWATQARAVNESAASFEKVVDAFDQVLGLSPNFEPGTVLVFLTEEMRESPFGPGYALEQIASNLLTPVFAMQATAVPPPAPEEGLAKPLTVAFTSDGIDVHSVLLKKKHFGYQELVLYRVTRDGEVHLLREIPDYLMQSAQSQVPYAPLARMKPGPFRRLKYYGPLTFASLPQDILDYRSGIALGENWSELKYENGQLSRWARDGAEILINPAGAKERAIRLVQTGKNPCVLEAVDEAGTVVARSKAEPAIDWILPLDPERINIFRLRRKTADPDSPYFRIARSGEDLPPHRKYSKATDKRLKVTGNGVMLGNHWHDIEGVGSDNVFRWVDNDAELVLPSLAMDNTLVLEVEPGPGLGQRVGELSISDKDGEVLHTQTLKGRQVLRVPLPRDHKGALGLRLHITNGGEAIPSDPRILNFRVFRAELGVDG